MGVKSEFGGEMDKDKTLPIEPRPLISASDKLRAGYLTGDDTGQSDTDGRFSFHGLDRDRFVDLAKESKKRKKNMPDRVITVHDEQA